MSKRNANTPLPNIGATEWGATLNNYLRAQEYNQKEIKDELANTIAAKNSTVAVNLSSGVVDTILEGGIHPGLYDGDDRLSHGAQLGTDKDYHYRGRVVFIADNNYTKEYSDAVDGENILNLSRYDNSEQDYDGWAIYLCHDKQGYHISWVSMNANNVSGNNSSIILDPNYILLGLVLKINGNYYWYEKTMISSDSITTKSWHLTQSFANLNTYFNCSDDRKLLPYTAEGVNAILLVQGYGLAPFSNSTDTNPNTNSHKNIIQQTLATYTGTPDYKFQVLSNLGSNITLNDAEVQYTFNNNLLYRLCATGIQLNDTPVLLLQEATSGEAFTPTNSENIDFINMILPFIDCVELYRFDGGSPATLKAAPGNGISSVNANGLNPHITTVIRDEDEVYFGNSEDDNFTFKTTDAAAGYQLSGNHKIAIPNDTVSDRWMLLNKTTLDTSIQLQTNREDSTIKLSAQEVNDSNKIISSNINISPNQITLDVQDAVNYSTNTTLATLAMNVSETEHLTLQDFKENRISFVTQKENSTSHPAIQIRTNDLQIYTTPIRSDVDNRFNTVRVKTEKINDGDEYDQTVTTMWVSPNINFLERQITLTAGKKPMIKVGGGAELRHDGLYLPSSGSGIEIGDVNQGLITIDNLKKGSVELRYPNRNTGRVYFNAYGITGHELHAAITNYYNDVYVNDYYRDIYFWVQIEDDTCVKLKADLWDSDNNEINYNQWADVYLKDQKWVSQGKNWKFQITSMKQEIHFILKPDPYDRNVVNRCSGLWKLLPVTERIMDIQTNEARIDIWTNKGLIQVDGNDVDGEVIIQNNNGVSVIKHGTASHFITETIGHSELNNHTVSFIGKNMYCDQSLVEQFISIFDNYNDDSFYPQTVVFQKDWLSYRKFGMQDRFYFSGTLSFHEDVTSVLKLLVPIRRFNEEVLFYIYLYDDNPDSSNVSASRLIPFNPYIPSYSELTIKNSADFPGISFSRQWTSGYLCCEITIDAPKNTNFLSTTITNGFYMQIHGVYVDDNPSPVCALIVD